MNAGLLESRVQTTPILFSFKKPNNAINSDSVKRCAFVAPLFTAGYGER